MKEQMEASVAPSACDHPKARNPYETNAKPLRGMMTQLGDQIPLLKAQNGSRFPSYDIYIHIYIYIYIYICCGVINWSSLGVFKVINWSKFAFSKHCLSNNTIKIGVSAHF